MTCIAWNVTRDKHHAFLYDEEVEGDSLRRADMAAMELSRFKPGVDRQPRRHRSGCGNRHIAHGIVQSGNVQSGNVQSGNVQK
jgi:hypothetical protein